MWLRNELSSLAEVSLCNKLNKSRLVGQLLNSIHDARTHLYKINWPKDVQIWPQRVAVEIIQNNINSTVLLTASRFIISAMTLAIMTLRSVASREYSKVTLSRTGAHQTAGIVRRLLTTGIRSEKCVVRWFRRCANVIACTYTNPDSTV